MAESFTSYSVDNDRRFRNAIKSVSDATGDLRIPYGQILRDFYRSQGSIFSLKGPGKYSPFKNSEGGKSPYQRRKIKKYGFDYPLLVASGRLASSLLGPNNPGSVASITKLSLIFGTSDRKAIFHQRGTKHMAMRKVLFIGPEAPRFASSDQVGRLQRWVGYLNDHMANVAIKNGLASRLPGGR